MSIAYFLTILFWPLDLFLENSFSAFLQYSLPATLTYLSIINPAFSLLIPIISPKLLLLPFFILIFFYSIKKINKEYFLIVFTIWAFIATARFNQFYGQSILKSDYESQQEVVRNTQLYDSSF